MTLQIGDRAIRRVHVIDDDAGVRGSYCDNVVDMELEPMEVKSVDNLDDLLGKFDPAHDGVICDYQLTSGRYSKVNGDVVASAAYRKNIPVILCTSYHPMTTLVADLRLYIPVVVNPDNLRLDTVAKAFELCISELQGNYTNDRKSCRTLIRIEGQEIFGEVLRLSIQIPAWQSTGIIVEVKKSDFPILDDVQRHLARQGEFRVSAEINLGAENVTDLYFTNWRLL